MTEHFSPPPDGASSDDELMAAVRSILLRREQVRIGQLDREAGALRDQLRARSEALQDVIRALQAEVDRLEAAQADTDALVARITPALTNMMGRTIRDSRDEMAEALGPVMGEAIRVQIRDSRKDMVEALYPVIGETVQRAIAEFARELQRNIDARLRATFGPQGALRALWARLRGVSPGQLALRDAMPFSIRELFLIQRSSGLLIAHRHPGSPDATDSDLIGGMLTAIRDFVRDAFGQGAEDEELDEVQYGDQRIIIQSGRTVFLAAVIEGVEPEGFRAWLREFVSELHVRHESALRRYSGDPASLPNLQARLAQIASEITGAPASARRMGRGMRLALAAGGLAGLILIGVGCFYLRFTLALLPVAFPDAAPTSTLAPTGTPSSTATRTPTLAPTSTATPAPSRTPTPSASNTPIPTPTIVAAFVRGNVWMRPLPAADAPLVDVLLKDTPVTVLSVFDAWVEVEWDGPTGRRRGWAPLRWIQTSGPIPPSLVTPTPGR
jgi:hypothetical protein